MKWETTDSVDKAYVFPDLHSADRAGQAYVGAVIRRPALAAGAEPAPNGLRGWIVKVWPAGLSSWAITRERRYVCEPRIRTKKTKTGEEDV